MPGSTRLLQGRGGGWMMAVGRMHPGKDHRWTEMAVAQFAAQLEQTFPASNAHVGAILLPAKAGFDNPSFVKPRVLALASALGVFASLVILVIICANLANLQLARAAARLPETAIRLSLGCSRARLIRQMLVESAVVAIPGLLIAAVLIRLSPTESLMTTRCSFRVVSGQRGHPRVGSPSRRAGCRTLPRVLRRASETGPLVLVGAGARRGSPPSDARILAGVIWRSPSFCSWRKTLRAEPAPAKAATGFRGGSVLFSVNVGQQGYTRPRERFYDACSRGSA